MIVYEAETRLRLTILHVPLSTLSHSFYFTQFPVNECKHDGLLRPISRFQETELHDAIAIMEPFLDLPSLKERCAIV